jgi:nitrate reductase gamma subunit
MASSFVLHLLTYASVAVFVIAAAVRAIRLYKMPIHLRWELYPVPHEGQRARYGGSYFESPEWWSKPRHFSLLETLRFMVPEMLLLKALWEHNRKLWYRSAPFHWGLYSLAALAGLLVFGALAQAMGISVDSDSSPALGALIHYLTILVGVVSVILGTVGAASLLYLRLTDDDLRSFTTPRDIFNLAFILVAVLSVWAAFLAGDRSFSILRNHVQSLLTFKMAPVGSTAVGLEAVVLSLLLAYIPLTHMSHFFTKWFTYHEIRWDDVPNRHGSKTEARVQEALNYRVSWSAPHIGGDGKKNWAEIGTQDVSANGEKKSN